jgi:hypothetical protein
MLLAVDLAARFSAATVLDSGRQVCLQFDSVGRGPQQVAEMIFETAMLYDCSHIFIEDVPYGISNQMMLKGVLRMQGRILQQRDLTHFDPAHLLFVAPATWQRHVGTWRQGTDAEALVARQLGYEPPDLKEMHADHLPAKGPERAELLATLRKARTDYVASFLIASWAADMLDPLGEQIPLTEIQGVQAA